MITEVSRAAAIRQQQAFKAAIVGLAHRGVHAHVGGDAGEHQVANPGAAQDQLEIGGEESTLAGLVDDGLAGERCEVRYDLPSRLAAHQYSPAGSGVADSGADSAAAPLLVRRQIGEVGAMAFSGMHHVTAPRARGLENLPDGLDRGAGEAYIVAHLVDVAALSAEID